MNGNNGNAFTEKVWEIKVNEILKQLLNEKVNILNVEYIDNFDIEGNKLGHTEIVFGTYKDKPFQIQYKNKEKILSLQFDAIYKNIFKKMAPALNRIVGTTPISKHNELPVPRMPVKYVLSYDALSPDFTLKNLVRREEMGEIYNLLTLNGKRKDFYRNIVKQPQMTFEK